jgi:hypothetical protein
MPPSPLALVLRPPRRFPIAQDTAEVLLGHRIDEHAAVALEAERNAQLGPEQRADLLLGAITVGAASGLRERPTASRWHDALRTSCDRTG